MSADPTWLQSLEQATSYRQLLEAFDAMWIAATSGAGQTTDSHMVDLIDQAIQRIEQERIRDQAELAEFNNQYNTFKEQNSGVVGWFKRKMPFTATRSQDVQLRESMQDQQAEILADNFVIACAQMLKEALLPPSAARCGQPARVYRDLLAANDSVPHLREFGNVISQLNREFPQAMQFIAALRADIDAFAAAKLSEKTDNNLKKASLEKAQQALAQLASSLDDKKNLITAAEDRLRKLIEQDLAEQDPSFRLLQQKLTQLGNFQQQSEQTQQTLDTRTQLLGKLKQKSKELNDLPINFKQYRPNTTSARPSYAVLNRTGNKQASTSNRLNNVMKRPVRQPIRPACESKRRSHCRGLPGRTRPEYVGRDGACQCFFRMRRV